MGIEVKNLFHYYESNGTKECVLNNVSLNIDDGEFVAVIGQTGSGKTTLVQYFNGLFRPSKGCGSVVVNGMDTAAKDLRQLRYHVGMVFQKPENQLFAESVYEDIAFGLRKQKLSEDEVGRRIDKITGLLDIDEALLEKSTFELSFGQKRRVAIAGVAVMEPKVLVMDEPMAGLDPVGREKLIKILKRLHEAEKNTIVMISHSMENVAQMASRVIVLNKGEILLDGTPDKVFREGDFLKQLSLDVPDITTFMKQFCRKDEDKICLSVDEAVSYISGRLSANKEDKL